MYKPYRTVICIANNIIFHCMKITTCFPVVLSPTLPTELVAHGCKVPVLMKRLVGRAIECIMI